MNKKAELCKNGQSSAFLHEWNECILPTIHRAILPFFHKDGTCFRLGKDEQFIFLLFATFKFGNFLNRFLFNIRYVYIRQFDEEGTEVGLHLTEQRDVFGMSR